MPPWGVSTDTDWRKSSERKSKRGEKCCCRLVHVHTHTHKPWEAGRRGHVRSEASLISLSKRWTRLCSSPCFCRRKRIHEQRKSFNHHHQELCEGVCVCSDLMMVCMPRTWGVLSITLRVLGRGCPWCAEARADLEDWGTGAVQIKGRASRLHHTVLKK